MLVEFKIGNYLSFKDIVTFSMVAANKIKTNVSLDANLFEHKKFTMLKSAVLYGANSSGKSNFLNAIIFFKHFLLQPPPVVNNEIPIDNFRLSETTINKPSFFEMTFFIGGIRYRYGFEITNKKVTQEWLFYVPRRQEVRLFIRNNNNIELGNSFKEGRKLAEKMKNNSLFLSVVAQFNGEISQEIINYFSKNINNLSGVRANDYKSYTINKLNNKNYRGKILDLLQIADLNITNIEVSRKKIRKEKLPEDIQKILPGGKETFLLENILTSHNFYDKNEEKIKNIKFNLSRNESKGTQKFFALAGPVLDTLENGKVLFIDELDASLHPILTKFLISLFNSKEYNKKNAQLIFATHSTTFLNSKTFRRDQIWFVEKKRDESSDLYSLIEFKGIREKDNFEKDYILGQYGAIPFIGNADILFEKTK